MNRQTTGGRDTRRRRHRHSTRRRNSIPPLLESLEHRRLLAISASIGGTVLNVTITAADNLTVTSSGGQVRVNGSAVPGGGSSANLTQINVICSGNFANSIDLAGVTPVAFGSLQRTLVIGAGGNDTLRGSPFPDELRGDAGNDTLEGNNGNDTLLGAAGANNLVGGAGDDVLDVSGGTAGVDAGPGSDTLRYTVSNPAGETVSLSATATERLELTGGAGNDTLTVSGGAQVFVVNGGGGNDTIDASGLSNPSSAVTLNGGAGNDTITGGAAGDLIIGGSGADNLTGNAGDDVFDLSGGTAAVNPGTGTDTIRYLVSNPAGETVSLSATATERLQITGGSGNDNITISGGAQLFLVNGGAGNDTISAAGVTNAGAAVTLTGDADNDTITGSNAGESISGGDGNDSIQAAGGNDTLADGLGNDTLDAGAGNDSIVLSASGDDRLFGQAGLKSVQFAAPSAGTVTFLSGAYRVDNDASGRALTMTGSSAVVFFASQRLESLSLIDNSVATFSVSVPSVQVNAIGVGPGATLDLYNTDLFLNVTPGSSPGGLAALNALVARAHNGGLWNRPGISSSALTNPAHSLGVNVNNPANPTAVIVRKTLKGDVNLDRAVDFADLVALAQNYNTTAGATWARGDFNYDAMTNFPDLVALAQNYGTSFAAATAQESTAPALPSRRPQPARKPLFRG